MGAVGAARTRLNLLARHAWLAEQPLEPGLCPTVPQPSRCPVTEASRCDLATPTVRPGQEGNSAPVEAGSVGALVFHPPPGQMLSIDPLGIRA